MTKHSNTQTCGGHSYSSHNRPQANSSSLALSSPKVSKPEVGKESCFIPSRLNKESRRQSAKTFFFRSVCSVLTSQVCVQHDSASHRFPSRTSSGSSPRLHCVLTQPPGDFLVSLFCVRHWNEFKLHSLRTLLQSICTVYTPAPSCV